MVVPKLVPHALCILVSQHISSNQSVNYSAVLELIWVYKQKCTEQWVLQDWSVNPYNTK